MNICADCVELGQQCYNCWAVTPSTLTDLWVRTKRAECDGLRADKEVLMAEKAEMLSWWAKEKEGFQARIAELEEMAADRQYADTDGMAAPTWKQMGDEVVRLREAQMQKLLNKMSDAPASDDASSEAPIEAVRNTIDHLLNGRVTPKDPEFRSLDRAMDQAKRGAVGTLPGTRG